MEVFQNDEVVQREDEYRERYGFSEKTEYTEMQKGLSKATVEYISKSKGEPEWMLEKRLSGYKTFVEKPTPTWGADLGKIDYSDIYYYLKPKAGKSDSWADVPEDIKRTFDRLGVPEAERKFFAGAEAQYDSEVVYHHVKEELEKQGVIFTDTDTAVKKYPELMKKYFGTIIPPTDNKFAALNTAVWSGGSFIYVPSGVKVAMPLQAYFRINAEKAGQFERTLIVADEGSDVTYVEGCFTAGTEITTLGGQVPIEQIKSGDMALTHRNRYQEVYHTQVRLHTGRLFHIKYFGDTSTVLDVTDEHPFLVSKKEVTEYKNRKWTLEWARADELKKFDYLVMPIDRSTISMDRREFKIHTKTRWHDGEVRLVLDTDSDFFRLIGYYLAEGSTTGRVRENYLMFTFNKDENTYINDVASLLKRYFGKKPLIQKEYKNGISIVLCSTLAATFFSSQFGKGAANKRVPEWVMHEALEKQRELLGGMWRGDGSFMNRKYAWGAKRMFRINTISKSLAKQLRDMLLRFNIISSINKQERGGNRHTMYCVYIGGENLFWFANLMGVLSFDTEVASGGGTRMLISLSQAITAQSYSEVRGDLAFLPIKEITSEHVDNLPVYNFSVREDESYVANGVAVHNCTAPIYISSALHSAVVEIVVHKNAHVRYVTVQNWSKNVYNLVTQRAYAYENAHMEWIDANIGSMVNMKYPSIFLKEPGSRGDILSIAVAGEGQVQDSGGKIYHLAPNTTSQIISKSVSKGSGVASYRGLIHIDGRAANAQSGTKCDALLLDDSAKTNTYPYNEIYADDALVSHEASVGRLGEDELFYLMSRGMKEDDAIATIVLGFIDPLVRALPLEYSLELKRLIKLDTTNSVA